MSTYRTEWPCCGSVTETQGYELDACPFCTNPAPSAPEVAKLVMALKEYSSVNNPSGVANVTTSYADAALGQIIYDTREENLKNEMLEAARSN